MSNIVTPTNESNNNWNDRQDLHVLYKENGELYRYFMDWRHKVLSRYFISLVSLFVMAQYFHKSDEGLLSSLIFIPFLLSGMVGIFCYALDNRNNFLIMECLKTGRRLEKAIDRDGYYSIIDNQEAIRGTYSEILKILYISSAALFILLSIYLLIRNGFGV